MSIKKVYAETNIMSLHVLEYFNSSSKHSNRLHITCRLRRAKTTKYGFSLRTYIKIYDYIGNPDNLRKLRSSINDIGQIDVDGNLFYLLIGKIKEQVTFLESLSSNVTSLDIPDLEQRVDLALKITEQRKKIRNLSPEELIQIGEWADQLNELNSSSIPANRQRKQVSIAEKIKGYLKSGNIT
jgi:hypothetical protein